VSNKKGNESGISEIKAFVPSTAESRIELEVVDNLDISTEDIERESISLDIFQAAGDNVTSNDVNMNILEALNSDISERNTTLCGLENKEAYLSLITNNNEESYPSPHTKKPVVDIVENKEEYANTLTYVSDVFDKVHTLDIVNEALTSNNVNSSDVTNIIAIDYEDSSYTYRAEVLELIDPLDIGSEDDYSRSKMNNSADPSHTSGSEVNGMVDSFFSGEETSLCSYECVDLNKEVGSELKQKIPFVGEGFTQEVSTSLSELPDTAGIDPESSFSLLADIYIYCCPFDDCDFQTDLKEIRMGAAAEHVIEQHNMDPTEFRKKTVKWKKVSLENRLQEIFAENF